MRNSLFVAAVLILSIPSFFFSEVLADGEHSQKCHCQAKLPCDCGADCDCPNCGCHLPSADSCTKEGCRDKRECKVNRVRRVVKRTTRTVHRVRAIRRRASRPAADPGVPMKWAGLQEATGLSRGVSR